MSTNENHGQDEPKTLKILSWIRKGRRIGGILCFVTVASLLAAIFLATALIAYYQKYKSGLNQMDLSNVCLTPGCVKAASLILSSLDENVDPCEDFYQFSCGEWLKTHHIPDDKSRLKLFDEVEDILNLQLKILLDTKLNGTEPSFIRKAKELYDTCMEIESIEKTGAVPLEKALKTLGGWPVVEGNKWIESEFDWLKTLTNLRMLGYGYNAFMSLSVGINVRNTSRHIIDLGEGSLGIDRGYLIDGLNDSVTAAYYKKMVKAATILGADESTAEKELLEVLKLEIILANYSLPYEETLNPNKFDNKYTVKELQKLVPQIPWLKYINGFLFHTIYEKEILNVRVPDYVKKIADLITSKEKRVIANYMLWKVVDESLPFLSKEFRDLNVEFLTVTGKSGNTARWKQCLPNRLDIALSSYYIRHHFNAETKIEVSEVLEYVYESFLRTLFETDLMDEKTKSHAKEKAKRMMFHIAYPEELLNNTAVTDYYKNLVITNDSYFENIVRIYKWSTDNQYSMLRKPNDRNDWRKLAKEAAQVNGFYEPSDNTILISAGYLQNPFFSNDRPNYLNFGTIGGTVGHEIMHAFDSEGRQFDIDENNVNWWTKATEENFRKRVQCIIDQYSNYTTETGMNLNGVNTQNENVADNFGLKVSYKAYQSWVKDNGPEQLLPGLSYSQNQLFWIASAALEWCTKWRPESLNDAVRSDNHSPGEFRVKGYVSNFIEFATDFNCPPDSPMNKKHKCTVW